MRRLLVMLLKGYRGCVSKFSNKSANSWEDQNWRQFFQNIGLLIAILLIPIGATTFLLVAAYRWRKLLLALVTPPLLIALLIASYFENHKKEPVAPLPPLPSSIEMVQANAKRAYRPMAQCAFLLLADLCRYLPGLIKPFSLAAVEAPVHFDITASMVTLYHFVIGKGENDAPVSAIGEILSSLISQHLQAQDLPVSVPAAYTGTDGSTWPGLVVDGVYDLGQFYRIDLAITNEAVISRLRARAASGPDGYDLGGQPVHDSDFD